MGPRPDTEPPQRRPDDTAFARDTTPDTVEPLDTSPPVDTAETLDVVRDSDTRDVLDTRDVTETRDGATDATSDGDTSGDPCVIRHRRTGHQPMLDLEMTADDGFQASIVSKNSTSVKGLGGNFNWKIPLNVSVAVNPGVRYVITVEARDTNAVVSGFIASASTHGRFPNCMQTGPQSAWRVTGSKPSGSWRKPGYDDSNWSRPSLASQSCRNTWNSSVSVPNARWIWHEDCNVGAPDWNERNWYRLEFEVRPP